MGIDIGGKKKYSGYWDCVARTYERRGILGFYCDTSLSFLKSASFYFLNIYLFRNLLKNISYFIQLM